MDLFGLRRRRYRKEIDKLGLDADERALFEAELARGDDAAVVARIERAQERRRREFTERTGIDTSLIVPVVGQQISWKDVVRQVFSVRDFDRSGTTVDPNNQVRASGTDAYGFLLVESPILNQSIRLPIIHRDDFLLATTVFDEPKLVAALADEVELLVTYAPKRLLPGGLSGSPAHVLHYVLVPSGTLERYYAVGGDRHMASPAPEKLFGTLAYDGEIRVQLNQQPEL